MSAKIHRQTSSSTDQRWISLNAVQAAMVPLGLRDRDIAVLRGLLSFIQADRWEGPLVVFASNNALRERCDGIDERTLRRRLGRLCDVGLIERQQSPNRKRYAIRSSDTNIVLAYGFDLAPLRSMLSHLEALAKQHARREIDKSALRAVMRDLLYRLEEAGFRAETVDEDVSEYRKMLRRNCSIADLQAATDHLETLVVASAPAAPTFETTVLTDSDSQIDRDIHSSNKEYYKKKHEKRISEDDKTISLQDCIECVPSAISFSDKHPENWHEVIQLAYTLAPAIGINTKLLNSAEEVMGRHGASLAVLGLVQAYPGIKHPAGYLKKLISKAGQSALSVYRMFKSLTSRTRFPAGNHGFRHV